MFAVLRHSFSADSRIYAGESLADQTVGSLTFFKGQRVFVDLAHASQDVSSPTFRTLLSIDARVF